MSSCLSLVGIPWRVLALGALLVHGVACSDGTDQAGDGAGDGEAGATSGGGTSGGTGGSSGGGTAGSSSGGTAGTGMACNDVAPPPDPIELVLGEGTAPTPEGGSIADGLYHGSTLTFYETDADCLDSIRPLEARYAALIQAESGSTGVVSSVLTAADSELRGTGDYSAEGTTLTTTPTCGGSDEGSAEYTATSTTLTLFANSGSCGPGVFFYTRQ